jgi:hypothetical protein
MMAPIPSATRLVAVSVRLSGTPSWATIAWVSASFARESNVPMDCLAKSPHHGCFDRGAPYGQIVWDALSRRCEAVTAGVGHAGFSPFRIATEAGRIPGHCQHGGRPKVSISQSAV